MINAMRNNPDESSSRHADTRLPINQLSKCTNCRTALDTVCKMCPNCFNKKQELISKTTNNSSTILTKNKFDLLTDESSSVITNNDFVNNNQTNVNSTKTNGKTKQLTILKSPRQIAAEARKAREKLINKINA